MAAFRVDKAFYVPHRDLVVLTGAPESGLPQRGWAIDLPKEVQGPGWVPIIDVQTIRLGEKDVIGVVLAYDSVAGAPFMEFSSIEGRSLDIRPLKL